MNEKLHEPVYRAAAESAVAELHEIVETVNRLRARQEQLFSALEALKLVVGSREQAESGRPAPVYTMNTPNQQQFKEQVQATA